MVKLLLKYQHLYQSEELMYLIKIELMVLMLFEKNQIEMDRNHHYIDHQIDLFVEMVMVFHQHLDNQMLEDNLEYKLNGVVH
jgi:hypothetical protein